MVRLADPAFPEFSRAERGLSMNQACLRRVALAAAAVMIAAAHTAAAQSVPPPPPQTSPAPLAPHPSPQSAADQRIQALRTQLHVTDAQTPQWNAFAQAMRDNATSTDALFRQRASSAATMSALDNMKSYAKVARAYADNTEALATAFEALYGVLSDQQKQAIDTLFRQDAARTVAQQQIRR
jgi:cytochrome c551/c552